MKHEVEVHGFVHNWSIDHQINSSQIKSKILSLLEGSLSVVDLLYFDLDPDPDLRIHFRPNDVDPDPQHCFIYEYI